MVPWCIFMLHRLLLSSRQLYHCIPIQEPLRSIPRTSMLTHTLSPELHVKVLVIGNSSVGKSSLLMRWSENQWLPEDEASPTIGVEVMVRT